jgi:hypothetical protein
MPILGSITKLQNLGKEFYSQLAKTFSANALIHETWTSMAHDLEHQTASLQKLPHSFWNRLKDEEQGLRAAVLACWHPGHEEQGPEHSLTRSLSKTLDFEEPLILGVYVPLIRHLRSEGSGQVLDLYIMVKAHISRLQQVIRSFSGDPGTNQRAASLIQTFEKEVQVPQEPPVITHAHANAKAAAHGAKNTEKAKKPKQAAGSPDKRTKLIPKRSKPLIKVSRRARG